MLKSGQRYYFYSNCSYFVANNNTGNRIFFIFATNRGILPQQITLLMIIYFSGTGNSLATARKIAEALDDKVMPMAEAVGQDLSAEMLVGAENAIGRYSRKKKIRLVSQRTESTTNTIN